MGKYDICILKQNIRKMMADKNVKQETICDITGLQQPQVSRNLSSKTSNFFTVEQILEIADYFQVTVDELLKGSVQKTENRKIQINAASDLLNALFSISQVTDIHIETISIPLDSGYCGYLDDMPTCDKHAIYFDNEFIDDAIREWKKIIDVTSEVKDRESGKHLLELWEKDIILSASKRPTSWKFRDMEEQGEYLVHTMARRWENTGCEKDPGRFEGCKIFFMFSNEDIQAAEKYIELRLDLPFVDDALMQDIKKAKIVLDHVHQCNDV